MVLYYWWVGAYPSTPDDHDIPEMRWSNSVVSANHRRNTPISEQILWWSKSSISTNSHMQARMQQHERAVHVLLRVVLYVIRSASAWHHHLRTAVRVVSVSPSNMLVAGDLLFVLLVLLKQPPSKPPKYTTTHDESWRRPPYYHQIHGISWLDQQHRCFHQKKNSLLKSSECDKCMADENSFSTHVYWDAIKTARKELRFLSKSSCQNGCVVRQQQE